MGLHPPSGLYIILGGILHTCIVYPLYILPSLKVIEKKELPVLPLG